MAKLYFIHPLVQDLIAEMKNAENVPIKTKPGQEPGNKMVDGMDIKEFQCHILMELETTQKSVDYFLI